ncbi:MAG: hypothetical protein N3G20_09230, partial [Verrucomicrobiae bacterium]|nr:hypothetical protein [Verrucomicrobiae bacterium]
PAASDVYKRQVLGRYKIVNRTKVQQNSYFAAPCFPHGSITKPNDCTVPVGSAWTRINTIASMVPKTHGHPQFTKGCSAIH